ncbi:NAD(P)-binding protein [Gonapodya prolifera JEL478]|uniref:NAD(P)-binding protein n=1 Tax=Gonapodya prolifera (strain JEL478) TaxID=1344416 RepID=A0A139AZF1_GONPJ|nr:NAD(P)-binding protein [Gonapodya prolifera JEL478]|eukprot:KXS21933.1 NAD(P)-binding protein [Gonapodya prolifera JEL478]
MTKTAEKVIVTGASGYIAAHVVDQFLKHGYRVVGTVRSASKGEYLKKLFAAYGDAFEYSIVPDMQVEGAFDEAAKGTQGFIHVASPFFTENVTDPNAQLVTPAVRGTLSALRAARAAGVRRVVVTSSFAAIVRASQTLPYTYTEADWNTDSLALEVPTYQTSKTKAEKTAWEYLEKEGASFDLVTMNPPLVVGPTIHETSTTSLNTSMKYILRYITGYFKEPPAGGIGWVHVRDLALAHVRAFERPVASNQRYLVGEGFYSWQDLCNVIRANYSTLASQVPVGTPGVRQTLPSISNEKVKRDLGIEFVPFETMVKESVDDCLALLKREGGSVNVGTIGAADE